MKKIAREAIALGMMILDPENRPSQFSEHQAFSRFKKLRRQFVTEEGNVPDKKKEDVAETEERELHEGDEDAQDDIDEGTPPEETEEGDPKPLTKARVTEILAGTDLSEPAREMLARSTYDSEEALDVAVKGLREIVKTAARSGQPFGMGGAEPQSEQGMKEREIAGHKRFNETLRRHGRPEVPLPAALRD